MTATPITLHNFCWAALAAAGLDGYDHERMTSMLRDMALFGCPWLNHSLTLDHRIGPVIGAHFRPVQYATPVETQVTSRCITPDEMAVMLKRAEGAETILIAHSEAWWRCEPHELMYELKKEARALSSLLARRRPDDRFVVETFVTDDNSMPVVRKKVGEFDRPGFSAWAAGVFFRSATAGTNAPVALRAAEYGGYSVTINGLQATGRNARFEDELLA